MLYHLLCLLAIISVACGQQWAIDTTSTATYLTGVFAASSTNVGSCGSMNGVGSVMETYDGTKWTATKVPISMVMGVAISKKTSAIVGPGIGAVVLSTDGGLTYSRVPNLSGIAQTADVYGIDQSKFAMVGTWTVVDPVTGRPGSIGAVATSDDNGSTFTFSSNVPAGSVRYGAFPSDNVWYVASGLWGEDPTPAKWSSRVSFDTTTQRASLNFDNHIQRHHLRDNSTTTGWFGAVSKSIDGGKTWNQVLSTNLETDYIYFNEISCGSELNCVVVGEGDNPDGGYRTVAYMTVDGGKTWEQTFSSDAHVSLTTVKFTSANEVWIAPTVKTKRAMTADFMKSTDGGKTFTLVQSLDNCMGVDIDFADGVGFAACISSSGGSASIAMYM